jgi:pto-interacting protein 1
MDHQGDNLRDFFQTNGRQVLQRVENNSSLNYFTENEIRNITDGYKSILGRGEFGEVYQGMLEDQTSVAVKRYIHGTQKEVFAKEVIVHSQINHKNVVRLLGCCTEENSLMIVMEFMSNGNLDSLLHGNSPNSLVPFPLNKRIKIAIEVAEVLWCMHSMYSPVLHGDIKPANILLDENLTPKISDFGIARLLCANGPQKTTTIIGSIGYIDPAYCESGILTPKSDVYSFGVVLLEIVTRKKVVDATLAQSFSEAITRGEDVQQMFDEEISVTENMKFLGDIGQLAAKCLQRDVKTRPEMVEVATSLRMIWKAMQRDKENLSQQLASVPSNSVPSKNVWSTGHQFGNLKNFNEIEMKKMTKNYRMTFGEELCECLYNGVLDKDRPVIVRQLKTCSKTDREMFLNTMSILSKKNHKNVVDVVGFHLGKSISECVYESFCDLSKSNFGSISLSTRNLYDTICSMKKIPLYQRLSIAVQCAEGLVHIHSLAVENPDLCGTSLLGNFRSVNIFLDKNLVPKIFNPNLSTFLGPSTVQKSIHDNEREKYYLHPRDVSSQLFNPKSDVYSFGVVLLELITWKTVRYTYGGRVRVLTTDFLHSYRTDCGAIEILARFTMNKASPSFTRPLSLLLIAYNLISKRG